MTATEPSREAFAVGQRYEAGLGDRERDLGAHFTPPDIAALLARWAFDAFDAARPGSERPATALPVVCDPSCGGGVFLVAAADLLVARGADPARVVNDLIIGIDLDPGAVSASNEALRAWADEHGVRSAVRPRVLALDAVWGEIPDAGGVGIVIGNPPFQNQLGAATARSTAERTRLTERFPGAAGGYVDLAALFALRSAELAAPGGVTALIQPRSFLVARDATGVRRHLLEGADLVRTWLPAAQVFAAKVDVCAVVLRKHGPSPSPAPVRPAVIVSGGRDGGIDHGAVNHDELAGAATWSPIWAQANGVPMVPAAAGPPIGGVATATAGFRDEYYGIVAHLHEQRPATAARVVSTAMVDPAICRWGTRPVTIARQPWHTPWLDRDALAATDERLARWVGRLMVPKVLVATQTKVIEAVADPEGNLVPLTPVIAVLPTAEVGIGHLEAALLAPAATAWALRRFGGGGMSPTALKLAARQLVQIPTPVDREAWDRAVRLIGAGAERSAGGEDADGARGIAWWRVVGRALNEAWAIDDDALVEWWLNRLPK